MWKWDLELMREKKMSEKVDRKVLKRFGQWDPTTDQHLIESVYEIEVEAGLASNVLIELKRRGMRGFWSYEIQR